MNLEVEMQNFQAEKQNFWNTESERYHIFLTTCITLTSVFLESCKKVKVQAALYLLYHYIFTSYSTIKKEKR